MRLRNIIVLGAFVAMSLGTTACTKKTEEQKPADSMMTPAPAAPAPAPTPAPAPSAMPDTVKKAGEEVKKEGQKMEKTGEKIKKEGEKMKK